MRLHAYVDETGNTGANLFDDNQPFFITAAMIVAADYDLCAKPTVRKLANSHGVSSLHANELGPDRIEAVSKPLLNTLRGLHAHFCICSVEKHYLATAKFVDTVFDSHENRAVPFHIYNARPLRLLLLFNIARILSVDVAKLLWAALMDPNRAQGYETFHRALVDFRKCTSALPDARLRQIVEEAIDWALKNPEEIQIHSSTRSSRYGHMPNVAIFPKLLQGIDMISKELHGHIHEIVHDRQVQFESTLREWHNWISNASPDRVYWPWEKPFSLRWVPDSKFTVRSSDDSVGIQSIDTVLWLYRRALSEHRDAAGSRALLEYVLAHAVVEDMSFESVAATLEQSVDAINSMSLSDAQIEAAKEMLEKEEENRRRRITEHSSTKFANDPNGT